VLEGSSVRFEPGIVRFSTTTGAGGMSSTGPSV
jgi:hypothetical protein